MAWNLRDHCKSGLERIYGNAIRIECVELVIKGGMADNVHRRAGYGDIHVNDSRVLLFADLRMPDLTKLKGRSIGSGYENLRTHLGGIFNEQRYMSPCLRESKSRGIDTPLNSVLIAWGRPLP